MARPRITINRQGLLDILHSERAIRLAEQRAAQVRDACNAESSWGGYESSRSSEGYPRARVWPIGPDADVDNARNNRMVRNLDAGRS